MKGTSVDPEQASANEQHEDAEPQQQSANVPAGGPSGTFKDQIPTNHGMSFQYHFDKAGAIS